jgi:hypothetical protein
MFLVDHNPYDVNSIFSLSYEHHYEEMIVSTDDQDLIIRELENHQFSSKEIFMDEDFTDQLAYDFSFKYPFAALMDFYGLKYAEISYFFNPSSLSGESCFSKEFLSLLLHFRHHLLISGMDEIFSVLKLLEWLLWKSTFT